MRPLFQLFITLISIFILTSCENDFSLIGEYQETTVVYGILNQKDDTAYIKITKAFLGEANALIMAQERDSSEYPAKLNVKIAPVNNPEAAIVFDTISIHNKQDGVFYSPTQTVYYATGELNDETEYKLTIEMDDREITATTPLVHDFSITKPRAGGTGFVKIIPGQETAMEFMTARNGRRYEVVGRFHFEEIVGAANDTINRYLDWYYNLKTAINLDGTTEIVSPYTGDQFFDYCSSTIPYQDEAKEGEVVKRIAGEFQFIVSAAAEELTTFISVYEPSNSIVQERPEYTNLSNGIGIFSSRNVEVRTKLLHTESLGYLDDLNIKFYFADK